MSEIKVLFIGDIVGAHSLEIVKEKLPSIIEQYEADFVVCNGENVVNGKGLSESEADDIFNAGADVITTGNHIWENWKSRPLLAKTDKVLRPLNYPFGNPGKGFTIAETKSGEKIAVLQLQGKVFMQAIECPFRSADKALKTIQEVTNNIIVDFHAEATAEKVAMGWHLDGRVSAVIGTHTHIQTADASILPNGTAYITDVGMTGPYDSVLGMRKDVALKRFLLQTAHKYEIATDDIRISGVFVKIDTSINQATYIESFIEPEFERRIG